jgi:DNA-directed RNA polymerase II subunit RPB2
MTVGQLIECIMGKAASMVGAQADATPFNECGVEDMASILESYGMEKYGNEILYNGRTGEMIHTEIFIGPTFYQRLKHMVADKMHSRGSNGPVVMLTRQPAEGRARGGGLRLGEMERDVLLSGGSSLFLKERLLDSSDNYRVFSCTTCGLMCIANPERSIFKCKNCRNQTNIVQVRIPYAMKLLMQELLTMGIAARMTF